MPTRVLITEFDPLDSDMLGAFLPQRFNDITVTVAPSVRSVSRNLAADYDLVLIDFSFADRTVLEVLREWSVQAGGPRIVALTGTDRDLPLYEVMHLNIEGIVHRHDGFAATIEAIRTVMGGGAVQSPQIARIRKRWQSDPHFFTKVLSPRQRELLGDFGMGLSTHEIALKFDVSQDTIRKYSREIARNVGVNGKAPKISDKANRAAPSMLSPSPAAPNSREPAKPPDRWLVDSARRFVATCSVVHA